MTNCSVQDMVVDRPYGTICERFKQVVDGTCKNCINCLGFTRDNRTGIKMVRCKNQKRPL